MRDYADEIGKRVAFLQGELKNSGAKGFVFANSGGKDCALAGILCKMACDNTVGVMLPCHARRNYGEDMRDAQAVAEQFSIQTRAVDLTAAREALVRAMEGSVRPTDAALANIAPRLRMATVYTIAASEGLLVVGTGNRSERYMGYFTKWGDGAYDLNPIADLTVTEIYAFLRHLNVPESILSKAPSAGLYEGQTDEAEMGVTYAAIDRYITTGDVEPQDRAIIDRFHRASEHKRRMPTLYAEDAIL